MAAVQETRPTAAFGEGATRMGPLEASTRSADQVSSMDIDAKPSLKTPTRDTFATEPAHQPPVTPKSTHAQLKIGTGSRSDSIGRTDSVRSNPSVDSGDVDMDDDDDGGSDNDSATSEPGRPSKKKRGQRFFCTEFPPCQLSFTRSEHLARHIRKHTGERPFQCHCLRRFSRLDNLRQHAQTVHVNEEIPPESLAATGTRFQRQIRTDRMRTPGHRARASTISSSASGGHTHGHSRNYSGSSIGSISDFGSPEDSRRRPQPLAIAQTPTRTGLTVDAYAANAGGHEPSYPYYNQSPTSYGSPGSVYSPDASSPIPQHMHSPIPMTPRALTWGERVPPNRRLSVPSGTTLFQPSAPYNPGPHYMSPVASSNASTYSNGGSIAQSPTSSVFSSDSRRDSLASEADIRRRTWHPGTYPYTARPATSGLSYYQTPDAPRPVVATQPAAAQSVRLPGIDSFDRATERPDAPPRRALSPMEVDSPSRRSSLNNLPASAKPVMPFDQTGLQHNRPHEIVHSSPQKFGSDGRNHFQRPETAPHPHPHTSRLQAVQPLNRVDEVQKSQNATVTSRQKKRQGWYQGPIASIQEHPESRAQRTSPEGSSSSDGVPTPSAASTVEYNPTIVHSNGDVESTHPGYSVEENHKGNGVGHNPHQFQAHLSPGRSSNDMERLDALVAVATSEGRAVERQ